MKNTKRVFALVGVLLLLCIPVLLVIGAFTASRDSAALFKASIFCAIVVPIMVYAYMLIYRLIKKNNKEQIDSKQINKKDDQGGIDNQ
ncbi:hypothetical protein GCM10023142_26810 [Anaerocolumna aminovalerica]|uniref:Putative hydrolase of the HAD superfamily n=1 Tax=Anaerocolumna aminovalerica TaxID=1527 RepID=A0A1I5HWA1_9FIRM|nr:hypothetical protein [Anaerocolumna aminovalerica]MBU5331064.1 hypothetical protein [Anaerocolumna aminovalerica]MDU6263524.1 hypothetical protein [Anaerocolumna aminovalerica]SFO52250.1 putative hydrolase of the HAD superfamily [Anaerocolumna aminovalerica]